MECFTMVLRQVCMFQEKLLRTLAACGNGAASANDAQDQFGNKYCDGPKTMLSQFVKRVILKGPFI